MHKENKMFISKYIMKLVTMMIVLSIIVVSVPVSAAKNKKVGSIDELSQVIDVSVSGTYILTTEESIKINIPAKLGKPDIKLVINAPNATITNNAIFGSVTI